MIISAEDIQAHKESGSWRALEAVAFQMVQDAEKAAKSDMRAALGGGTRLMLSLSHRISDDIDRNSIRTQYLPNFQETIGWAKDRIVQLSAKNFESNQLRPIVK